MQVICLFILALFSHILLDATIQNSDTFEPLWQHLNECTERSLFVFDVDRVLIESKDALLQARNSPLLQPIKMKYLGNLPRSKVEQLISEIHLQTNSHIIDSQAIMFIKELQSRNIPVIALTATRIGGLGKIPSIQDWRIEDLASHEISFATSFPETPYLSLTTITGRGPSPVFKQGILFSATYPKGVVLRAFLDKVGFFPDRVIFIDDMLYNLQSVEESLAAMGIENVLTYHFHGADKLPNGINLDIAELKFKTLVEKELWLKDVE